MAKNKRRLSRSIMMVTKHDDGHEEWCRSRSIMMVTKHDDDHEEWWSRRMMIATKNNDGHEEWWWPRRMMMTTKNDDDHEEWWWPRRMMTVTKIWLSNRFPLMARLVIRLLFRINCDGSIKFLILFYIIINK